ncbi:MAG: hypothetical protein JNL38_03555 [Myxococcales bacterium]|jgi:hypothetical protein|nr:hypothetical protein [Myxococcales bacterium]
MKKLPFFAACSLFTLFAAEAAAEAPPSAPVGPDTVKPAAEAYCRYVGAVASSTSAPMLSPALFASGGLTNGNDVSGGGSSAPTSPRLVAGVSYTFSGLYRGLTVRKAAEAECARYESFTKLLAFTYSHHQGTSAPALAAKQTVLRGAMPDADAMLARARKSLQDSRITVEELEGIAMRVDALHAAETDTSGKLRAAQTKMTPPAEPIDQMVARLRAQEREVERRQAAIRQSASWDVTVRGGYDRVFGQSQPIPAFGMVTITLNPGYFWQTGADERAVEARADAAYFSLESSTHRAVDLVRELRELRRAEVERLAQLDLVLGDLEARYKVVAAVEGDKAHTAAELMWLSIVPVKAERAYLVAHVADLDKSLGPNAASLQIDRVPAGR